MKKLLKWLVIILLLISTIFIALNFKTRSDLKKKGYTNLQIQKIYDLNLDTKLVLKYDYCENIDAFFENNLNINLEEFLSKCNEQPEPHEPEDPFITKLKSEKYYIPDNLQRYLSYNDGVKSTSEIVTEVNCNLDKKAYVDISEADITKRHLMLVNKYYYLKETYVPENKTLLTPNQYTTWQSDGYLDDIAYNAFIQMVEEAKEQGYYLMDTSPFRDYELQEYLYNNYVKNNGLVWADKSSARPGHSEHQTGLATDIIKKSSSMYDFKNTEEFKWMSKNAYKYGFILRYPEGKEHLTGYKYEPWHYRYVGVEAAKYIYENDIVFEEYYAYFCEYKNEC